MPEERWERLPEKCFFMIEYRSMHIIILPPVGAAVMKEPLEAQKTCPI